MRKNERGFSLMEMTVTMAVVSMLMIIVYTMIEDTVRATMFNESHNDLAIMAQRSANFIQGELLQTRVVFQEDAAGAAYRSALQIPVGVQRWTTTLLPVLQTSTTTLVPDEAAARFTGNSLLIARQMPPLSVTWNHDGDNGTPMVEFLADRYRFEYFFLSPVTLPRFGNVGPTLDLMRATSVEYADYFQLTGFTRQERRRLAPRITATGITRVWYPGQPLSSAFFDLEPVVGDGRFDPPINNPAIAIVRTASLFPELRGGRISGRMEYSVGYVPDSPAQPFRLPMPVSLYARPSVALPRFPSGFEVKIVGPSGNRQVMTRILLMSRYQATHYEAQQAFVTTAARF